MTNKLTKEELEKIKYWCRQDHEIMDKITAMINSCCEHSGDGHIYWGISPKTKCTKCGEYY